MLRRQAPTPLQVALAKAKGSPAQEIALRQAVIYAFERADIDVVIRLGKELDRILDEAAKCPTEPQALTDKDPRTKPRRRKARVR